MKFELLPNEILLDYLFEYLSGLDIFYAFDGLNYRLNNLIRSIPLHLNFRHANKSKFGQFCRKMLLNLEIKNQIYSLHLSDKEIDFQIESFLSFFSLNEFINLRSLTVTEINNTNAEKMKSMLSLIPQLSYLHLTNQFSHVNITLGDLPMSKLQTLSIISPNYPLNPIHETSLIRNLTISHCFINDLNQLLKHTPMLTYLNIQCLDNEYINNTNISINDSYAVHLKQMIIGDAICKFYNFEIFVKQIPNLKNLTISTTDNRDMIYANKWQQLITVSLPQLSVFKFKFGCSHQYGQYNVVLDQYDQFQTYFWKEQHHCLTEYAGNEHSAFIYTIPYISNKFELTPNTTRYYYYIINNCDDSDDLTSTKKKIISLSDQSVDRTISEGVCQYIRWRNMANANMQILFRNAQSLGIGHNEMKKRKRTDTDNSVDYWQVAHDNKVNIFKNVTNLTLNLEILTKKSQYYFSNVTSLTLIPSKIFGQRILTIRHIEYLKTIFNLYNLKHLNIERIYVMESSFVLLEILKQAPQLSSITFIPKAIIQFFYDDQLCKYLDKMIKKIILTDYFEYYIKDPSQIKQFCEIFSNIEYLECKINYPDNLLLLLNHLPKLASVKATAKNEHYPERKFSAFENAARQLNIIFDINHVFIHDYEQEPHQYYQTKISIWIGNQII